MKEIEKRQNEIIEEFSFFDDWVEKYSHLIDQGKDLAELNEEFKSDTNLISGCQSKVWIEAKEQDGRIQLKADSNSSIAKGIVALVLRVLSDLQIDEVLENDLYFIDKIGLKEHLSPSRSNGLSSMIKQVKMYAFVFKQKSLLS